LRARHETHKTSLDSQVHLAAHGGQTPARLASLVSARLDIGGPWMDAATDRTRVTGKRKVFLEIRPTARVGFQNNSYHVQAPHLSNMPSVSFGYSQILRQYDSGATVQHYRATLTRPASLQILSVGEQTTGRKVQVNRLCCSLGLRQRLHRNHVLNFYKLAGGRST
jgi:hypothetical protein